MVGKKLVKIEKDCLGINKLHQKEAQTDFKMGHKYEPIPRKGDTYKKAWGHELWIVNDDEYCGKLLVFNKDKKIFYALPFD
jgi:hypothetical protein